MKKANDNQTFVLIEQVPGISKITGHPMTTITLVGTSDKQIYTTYIDSNNHNHSNWQHILNSPTNGFILSNLRTKVHKEKLLINADSKPVIAAECLDKKSILDALEANWKEQDARKANKFKDLFE